MDRPVATDSGLRRRSPGLLPGLLAAGLLLAAAAPSAADQEGPDPVLRELLREAAAEAHSFDDRFHAQVWLVDMSQRLGNRIDDPQERVRILKRVHYEARRVKLPPELVLAVIDVESNFDRFAVSRAGARGLMQVMPFWLDEIGRPDDNLFHIDTNLRLGCTILRYYYDMEDGDLQRALARYNGSLGKSWYPNRVLDKLRLTWRMKVGSGRSPRRTAGGLIGSEVSRRRHRRRFPRHVGDPRRLGPLPQPLLEPAERPGVAAGEHLHAPVAQIAGMSGDAVAPRLLPGAGTEPDALHPAADQEPQALTICRRIGHRVIGYLVIGHLVIGHRLTSRRERVSGQPLPGLAAGRACRLGNSACMHRQVACGQRVAARRAETAFLQMGLGADEPGVRRTELPRRQILGTGLPRGLDGLAGIAHLLHRRAARSTAAGREQERHHRYPGGERRSGE